METGIYQIRNIVTNKRYIGSAVNITKRWNEHRNGLVKNNHGNLYLQRAWNKYGSDSFEFSIVLLCEKEELIIFEQRKINRYKISQAGIYNLSPTAGNNLGVKFSQETKDRISNSQKGKIIPSEQREKIRQTLKGSIPWNKGILTSEETRQKLSKSLKGRTAPNKGILSSNETKQKLSDSHKGYKISEEQKKKISVAIKNVIEANGGHWNVGFKHDDKTKQRISNFQKGIVRSEETRRRMSEAKKADWAKRKEELKSW